MSVVWLYHKLVQFFKWFTDKFCCCLKKCCLKMVCKCCKKDKEEDSKRPEFDLVDKYQLLLSFVAISFFYGLYLPSIFFATAFCIGM